MFKNKKRTICIVGVILFLLLCFILIIFLILHIEKEKNRQELARYFQDKIEITALSDVLSKQEEKDKEFSDVIKDKKYTFDEPYISIDPYGISPLTALIIFQTKKSVEIKVFVNDIFVTTMEKSKVHSIPIYGLKAGVSNKVTLQYDEVSKDIIIERKDVSFPNLDVSTKNENATLDKELYFLSSPDNMNVSAYDGNGNTLWYLKGNYALDLEFLESGRIYVNNGESSGIYGSYGGFYEMNFLGKIYKNYSLRNGYHHELVKMNDESILVLGGKEGNDVPYSESYIYQIDKSGNIIASFDIYDLFSNIDLEFAESLRGTDMVVNSAYYQEDNHELILSLRGINSILSLNYETKKINWIFGDSNFYSSKFSSLLLKVTDGSRLPNGAHTAFLTSEGYLGLFNNGYNTVDVGSIYIEDHKNDYSSAVLYKIEDKNISTIWEYDADQKYFTYALGSFVYETDGSKLINFGWAFKESAYVPNKMLIAADDSTYARIIELNKEDKELFHATYPKGVYRTYKHKLYEETTQNYNDFSYELVSNHLETTLEKVKTQDISSVLDGAIENPYDFDITTNSISMNVFFSDSESVDLYLVSEKRDTYLLRYKKVNEAPLSTINLQIKGNYAVYIKVNDQMYNTGKIFKFGE